MRAKTKEEWIQVLSERSVILNPPPNDRSKFPRVSKPIFGIGGMRNALEKIISKEITPDGKYVGELAFARQKAKDARKAWESWKSLQPDLDKKTKPFDHFADEINQWDARIEVLAAESRRLHKLLEAEDQKAAHMEEKKKKRLSHSLSGKMRNGNLIEFAGRKVIEDENGNNIFKDDRMSVSEYVLNVKNQRKKRRVAHE